MGREGPAKKKKHPRMPRQSKLPSSSPTQAKSRKRTLPTDFNDKMRHQQWVFRLIYYLHSLKRMNRMFGPGGSLDSQTTETQWYEGLTGCDGRFSEYHEDGTPIIRTSFFPHNLSYSWPDPLLESQKHAIEYAEEQEELRLKARKTGGSCIFPIKNEEAEAHLPSASLQVNSNVAVVQSLVDTKIKEIIAVCTERLEGDLEVVTARRDSAFRELAAEREWVRILELTLRNNEIPLPRDQIDKL